MNILLIAPDSKLPNLALMKISAYHKAKGDNAGLHMSNPDLIYGSIIFQKNKHLINSWKSMYPGVKIVIGGPGYDPKIILPREIELMPPDQTLYNSQYSIGSVTTGCPRKCPFCMVPLQRPKGIEYIQPPSDIYRGGILRLLDDNILAMPKAFWEVHNFCIEKKIKIHFEYLDIRLVTPEIAQGLKEMKHHNGLIHFSYDITAIEKAVRRGMGYLIDAGIRPGATEWLIYMHDEASIPDAAYRWDVIRELGGEPFLMINNEHRTDRLRKIARRGCRPAIWRNLSTAEVFDIVDMGNNHGIENWQEATQ